MNEGGKDMKTLESTLRKELSRLTKLLNEAEKRLKTAPKGQLRISKNKNRVEYYFKSEEYGDEQKNGRYLKKKEEDLARKISQRDYDACVLKYATERVKAIETFLEKYKKTSLEDLYEKTNPNRRELINAAVISDEKFINLWQAVQYEGKQFIEPTQVIITEKGERVRSKSEKIIADKLYMLGIPYRYEYPILLDGNVKMYPDFTILKMPAREEVYLEHFGMMDDIDYVNTVCCKVNTYERNGIYLGVKLFVTLETARIPINTKALDQMLKELFFVE